MFQSCNEEKDQYVNCVEGLDIDEFHLGYDIGASYLYDTPHYYYLFGNNDQREFVSGYVNFSLSKDKSFTLFVRVPCDLRGDRFPICEPSHFDEGEFLIDLSGTWDFTQSYYEFVYGNNNRRLEIVGDLLLDVESSPFEDHVGDTIKGDFKISCEEYMGTRYSALNLEFAVNNTDAIKIQFNESGPL